MTIRAKKFTPEVLINAPRRSAGIPNSDGSKVLYSVSTYSLAEHSKKSEIRVLDVKSQETSLITDDASASDPKWLSDEEIVLLVSNEDGTTIVKVGKADGFANSSYAAGKIEGPVGDLRIHAIGNHEYAFAVSGKATPGGDLVNPTKAEKPYTSGRVYNSMFVRHWDHYVTENRNSIWLAKLGRNDDRKFELSQLKNALKGTGLESPIEPFGGTDHFDISDSGLVFTAKDPGLNPALHTKTNIYLITSSNFWNNANYTSKSPIKVDIYGFEGASTSPVFSPDGKQIAFLSMKTDGYESDKNQVFYVPDVSRPSWVVHPFASDDGKGSWNRSPQAIIWSPNNKSNQSQLYFLAADHGRGCLFASHFLDKGPGLTLPKLLLRGGSISDVRPLKNGDLFISSTSLIENSIYSLLPFNSQRQDMHTEYDLPGGDVNHRTMGRSDGKDMLNQHSPIVYISSQSKGGAMFGLSRRQIDEVHWPGAANDTSIHAWVVKPSDFDSKKKYPLAYLIHGGPQGAWEDAWSTRWNPAVFAEQGYVVICPNPTGSTGYGQDLTDAIQGQWGGLPYEDLVNGFDWIKKNMAYVDTDRAVALGASYGGYMMNWIQGHPLGRQFKCLVTHDGVFSMTGQLASEELYFPFHDLKSPLWKDPQAWARWDPSAHTAKWSTPHLIIHNELDYRLTISEGLAAFHTLQSRGVESQFLTFPDENHWVLKPENSLLWHETVLDWINAHVGLEKYTVARRNAAVNPASLSRDQK